MHSTCKASQAPLRWKKVTMFQYASIKKHDTPLDGDYNTAQMEIKPWNTLRLDEIHANRWKKSAETRLQLQKIIANRLSTIRFPIPSFAPHLKGRDPTAPSNSPADCALNTGYRAYICSEKTFGALIETFSR